MTKYYVTNPNGDWWTFEENEGDTVYLISEEDLKAKAEDFDPSEVAEVDDLEGDIISHGQQVSLKGLTFDEGVKYALEYLSDLYDGVYQTDLAAIYDPANHEPIEEEE